MKNKEKKTKKTKKAVNKEVKRPSNKKPRPKKFIEAKIPDLPPIPAEVPVTNSAEAAPQEKQLEFVDFKIPREVLGPQKPEERFVELLQKAANIVKTVAETPAPAPRSGPETVFYEPGGIGLIRRVEYSSLDFNPRQIVEDLRSTHGWAESFKEWEKELKDPTQPDIVEVDESGFVATTQPPDNDPMFEKVVHLKEVAAEQNSCATPQPTYVTGPKKSWFIRRLLDKILRR